MIWVVLCDKVFSYWVRVFPHHGRFCFIRTLYIHFIFTVLNSLLSLPHTLLFYLTSCFFYFFCISLLFSPVYPYSKFFLPTSTKNEKERKMPFHGWMVGLLDGTCTLRMDDLFPFIPTHTNTLGERRDRRPGWKERRKRQTKKMKGGMGKAIISIDQFMI